MNINKLNYLLAEFANRLDPGSLLKLFKQGDSFKKIKKASYGVRLKALNDFQQDWFYVPITIIKVYNAFFNALYRSYRSQVYNNFIERLNRTIEWFENAKKKSNKYPTYSDLTIPGFSIIGISGIGKTTLVNRVLNRCFKQIIPRENTTQISYIITNCTHDSSLKGMLSLFIFKVDQLLNTNYSKQYIKRDFNIHMVEAAIASLCVRHHIGCWLVDECHNLNSINRQSQDQILNFFKNINSIIGLPIIYIGTPEMVGIFSKNFQVARRAQGLGTIVIDRYKQDSDEWKTLIGALWKRQVLRRPGRLKKEIEDFYYSKSQGIMDILVAIHILVQEEALEEGEETITLELLESAYQRLPLTTRGIRALASGEEHLLRDFPDLSMKVLDFIQQVMENDSLSEAEVVARILEQGFDESEIGLIIKALITEYPNALNALKKSKSHEKGKRKSVKSASKKKK